MRVIAVILSMLMIAGAPATSSASHNTGRTWDQQQYQWYNYAPCYRYLKNINSDFRSRVSEARTKWNGTNTEFYIWHTTGTCAKDIEIDMYNLPIPFDGQWAYVANDLFTNISYSTINFNSCKDGPNGCVFWHTGTGPPPADRIDALSVATHEFGHTIELGHSTVCESSCSVMYPYINVGDRRRNLNSHDYQSIRSMYSYPAT
jgi:hypothetical protein